MRGRTIPVAYRVAGPYLVKGAPDRPLFLLVVRGSDPRHGKRRRQPAFWLVSAERRDGAWRLPLPPQDLLAWAWQRWEVEVAHREQKTGFGLGEPQCWGPVSAVLTVQWAAALYATTVLAGLRAWGLGPSPLGAARGVVGRERAAGRWTRCGAGSGRSCGATPTFGGFGRGTGRDPAEIRDWAAAQTNAVLAARR